MELVRVDTQLAYDQIRTRIVTLDLAPGDPIDPQALARAFNMGVVPVEEALKLLAHDDLVRITPRYGIYVADVSAADLEQISETRLPLETLGARLAAQRASADDVAVLEALCQEQASLTADDPHSLFALDHRFHQAIAQAAHNRYLARVLDHFFGLSQRLWYLALPHLEFLPTAVGEHVALVEAISAGDAALAEQLMRHHVQDFYDNVREVLQL